MHRAQKFVGISLGVVVLAQLVRPNLQNPSVVAEPHWDRPQTRDLVRRACFDCHSNETIVPWYGQVAPFRWLIAHHVSEARENLNFSDPSSNFEVKQMVREIRSGGMPTWDYRLAHARARLTKSQQDSLVAGLLATFAPQVAKEDVSPSGETSIKDLGEDKHDPQGRKDAD